MSIVLFRAASSFAVVILLLAVVPQATAHERYRPPNERVVCMDGTDSAPVYTKAGGTVLDRLADDTSVQVLDYVFGPQNVSYFEVNFANTQTAVPQTGFIRTDDVKNFCGFGQRRAVTQRQFRAPPNTCHLIGASRQSLEEVNTFRVEYQRFYPSMAVFISDNGWYAISLGLVRADAVEQIESDNVSIPGDAYCSDGANYIGVLEKRADSFEEIEISDFASLADRFAAANILRKEADGGGNDPLYKRACDLGDLDACGRYANSIRDHSENTDADIIQRNHYDLLGCMRGAVVDCNNAFNLRRTLVDHVLSPTRLKSGEGHPLVADELARIGCDGDVWPSCRHLGEQTWGDDPIAAGEFPLALHAMHAACTLKGNPEDDICRAFAGLLDSKKWRDNVAPEPFGAFEVARINAQSCQHDPKVAFSNCAAAYDGFGTFLAGNVGTAAMQNTARNFLIDGCEIGDSDACVAFNAGKPYMVDSVAGFSDILRVGRTAYVCNAAIGFTNMRNQPTSDGSLVVGRLPDALPVEIVENIINDAGYLYYKVQLRGARQGVVDERGGYIYHAAVKQYCDRDPVVSQDLQDLSLALARTNDLLLASDIQALNAGFDGEALLLTGLPGLRDIAPLAGSDDLIYLDLSRANVTDLTPLANATSLATLSLYYTPVTDIRPLAGLTKLRTLNLRGTNVTDLSALANLTSLEVFYPPQSDTDLTPLQRLIDAGLRVE